MSISLLDEDENKLDFPPLVNLFLFGVLNSAEAMLLPILIYFR